MHHKSVQSQFSQSPWHVNQFFRPLPSFSLCCCYCCNINIRFGNSKVCKYFVGFTHELFCLISVFSPAGPRTFLCSIQPTIARRFQFAFYDFVVSYLKWVFVSFIFIYLWLILLGHCAYICIYLLSLLALDCIQ